MPWYLTRSPRGRGTNAASRATNSARDAGPDDLLWAHALLLGTPENFGDMSGALKDFFDRTFYPVEGRIQSLPYAVFIGASNDGSGALRAIRRIANGYPLQEVQEPVIGFCGGARSAPGRLQTLRRCCTNDCFRSGGGLRSHSVFCAVQLLTTRRQ
jgi:multimeric flavodoxin WrbA